MMSPAETAFADAQKHVNGTPHAAPRPTLQIIRAKDLLKEELPPLEWAIPDILPMGLALFVGRGKDGKSLLAWNLCMAVATGGTALGAYDVEQGAVLYMALEDGQRRAQRRLQEQLRAAQLTEAPENLDLVLWDAPRVGEGLEDDITDWLDAHPTARLIVIDILEKVRPARQKNGSIYADDYHALAPLQRLAQERNIAILVVHHSNKTKPDDFRDTASGSTGLIGACDTFWSLARVGGEAEAALRIIGRDVESQELALAFKNGFWSFLGDLESYQLSATSKTVLRALTEAGKPLTPKQLAVCTGDPEVRLRKQLTRMMERGEVRNIGGGLYIPGLGPTPSHPASQPTPSPPSPPREREERESCVPESVTADTADTGATAATAATLSVSSVSKEETVANSDRGVTGSDRGGVTLCRPGESNGYGQKLGQSVSSDRGGRSCPYQGCDGKLRLIGAVLLCTYCQRTPLVSSA